MSAPTPGPWVATRVSHRDLSGHVGFEVRTLANEIVAEIQLRPYAPVIISEANARLMASAPDLLKELKYASEILGRAVESGFEWAREPANRIDAAIAKVSP